MAYGKGKSCLPHGASTKNNKRVGRGRSRLSRTNSTNYTGSDAQPVRKSISPGL